MTVVAAKTPQLQILQLFNRGPIIRVSAGQRRLAPPDYGGVSSVRLLSIRSGTPRPLPRLPGLSVSEVVAPQQPI